MKLVEHKSLDKVDSGIGYVQKFLAIISGLLLLVGLVSATWNTLTDDWLFQFFPWIQHAWAGDQALAVDANLSLVFIYLFTAFRDKEWIKVGIYTVIGGLLLFVAAVVMNIESVRQALGTDLSTATRLVGVDLLVLTRIRSYVIVGLVAMSGAATIDLFTKPAPKTEPAPTPTLSTEAQAPVSAPAKPAKVKKPRADQNGNSNVHRYQAYMQLNPQASARQASTSLNISLSTIARYRREEKKEATHDGLQGFVQLSAAD